MAKVVESQSRKPVRDVRAFEEKRVLTLAQATQLERSLDRMVPPGYPAPLPLARDAYAIRVLLRTGLRRFEFCKLRCGDIEDDKLRVVGKGNLKDYVPLFPAASAALAEWKGHKWAHGEDTGPRAFLFLGRGKGPLSFSALRLAWKEILKRAGLPGHFGLHSLRHTAGLIVYGQTGDLAATARFLRHTSIATTSRFYLHVDVEKLRAQLGKVGMWSTEGGDRG